MPTWLQKLTQKYPGGTYVGPGYQGKPRYNLETPEKFQYWGYQPSRDWQEFDELGRNVNLSRIPPQHIKFIVQHLAEKYYPPYENVFLQEIDFCRRSEYGPAGGSPETTTADEQLWQEAEAAVRNLTQRYEVTDKDFAQQLTNFIRSEAEYKMEDIVRKKSKSKTFFVRVYGSSRAFGGHEEGGWWYDAVSMVHEEQAQGIEKACQRRSQLEKEYQSQAKDSFYEDLTNQHGGVRDLYDETSSAATGMGDLDYGQRDSEGMDYPKGWTTSSFEKYFAQVELTPEPKSETKQRPHYE